jgi:hypothetical protein
MGAPRNEMKIGHYGAGGNHMAGDGLDGGKGGGLRAARDGVSTSYAAPSTSTASC